MPYLYEGRQHQRKLRESLDCALALRELENLGVSNVVTFDAHDTRVQNAIPLTGFENLHATYQIIREILHTEKNLIVDRDHMVVVSPDSGAVERCLYYANNLGLDLSLFYKRRDTTCIVNGKNPIVAHELLGGSDIAGKDILIVDDIMASGLYEDGIMQRVYATNLTYRTPELLASPWFVDVDLSRFVAYFIDRLNRSESIRPFDKLRVPT